MDHGSPAKCAIDGCTSLPTIVIKVVGISPRGESYTRDDRAYVCIDREHLHLGMSLLKNLESKEHLEIQARPAWLLRKQRELGVRKLNFDDLPSSQFEDRKAVVASHESTVETHQEPRPENLPALLEAYRREHPGRRGNKERQ